ncbi:MAG TPA: FAD-dependent oxidoreductase [Steroidobacteraceae bacterium]|nr:FAD-dependent oxidoreductase [Steroidobacteraceae bacterium]
MSTTRREFLRQSVAATTLAVVPQWRAWSATDVADVIVVGAGLSGLMAAFELERAGCRVVVLEARNRVGGKILTFSGTQGAPEAGGNIIYGDYRRLLEIANTLGVVLEDQVPRLARHVGYTLVLDGQPISRKDWPNSPRNPFPPALREMMPWQYVPMLTSQENPLRSTAGWYAPDKARLDVSMRDFLRAQGATDAIIDLAYDTIPTYGMNAKDVSALLMAYVSAYTSTQKNARPVMYQARGGNQRIPEAMAGRLRSEVRFGQAAKAIRATDAGVEVHTTDGARYAAKACVCALPFATLREVDLEPSLTGAQARAVRTLPHQAIHQVALHVTRPFWETDGMEPSMWTDSHLGRVSAIYHGADADEVSSLVVSAFGPAALHLDRLGQEAVARHVVAEIERMRPAAKGTLTVTAQHSWTKDRYAGGAWAYFHPGTVTKFLPAMNAPSGRVHFCGEQTALASRGMEGALESGERAAQAVVAQLG